MNTTPATLAGVAPPDGTAVVWHVSDPHLGSSGARAVDGRGWHALADRIRVDRPHAVVVTGDLVADDPDDEADHLLARRMVTDLAAPVWTVPGNHDVGDQTPERPGLPPAWTGVAVTSDRCSRWTDRWGPDQWCVLVPGWALLGLNSQVMGSGLPEEARQWRWLDEQVARLGGRRLAVFTHQAPDATALGLPADSWTAIPPEAATRLRDTLAPAPLRLLAHGHIHRHHVARRDGVLHVAAPSIAAAIPARSDMHQPAGDERLGWVEYRFRARADPRITPRLLP